MMTNKLLIDTTVDAYTTYQVYATEGTYSSFVQWPALKEMEQNDWQEYDGIEVDASAPRLDTRTLTMQLACNGGLAKHDAFLAFIYSALRAYTLVELGKTLTLRVTGEKSLKKEGDLILFTVEFADDSPLSGYTYAAPASTLTADNTRKLDSIPFTQYGVRFLQGTAQEVLRHAQVRENLTRNISILSGAISNPIPVRRKSRSIKLTCLMTAETVSGFWHNWNALLYDLTRAGERTLTYATTQTTCIYQSCQVREFLLQGSRVWCGFSLKLTETAPRTTTT